MNAAREALRSAVDAYRREYPGTDGEVRRKIHQHLKQSLPLVDTQGNTVKQGHKPPQYGPTPGDNPDNDD